MTARDLARSIEPGSIPHGDRQTLESNLPAALSQQEQAAGPVAPNGGSLAIPEDPVGALLSGEIAGDPNEPTTAGLSVGPGDGPAEQPDVMLGNRAERLRQLATESTSPILKDAARNELRRMAREGI